jgi:Smg protein
MRLRTKLSRSKDLLAVNDKDRSREISNMLVVKSEEHSIVHAVMILFSKVRDIIKLESDKKMGAILQDAGFPGVTVLDAIAWLRSVVGSVAAFDQPTNKFFRVYDGFEPDILGPVAVAKLCSLESEGVLDFATREAVIDHLLMLDCEEVDEQIVVWVALIVLYYNDRDSSALSSLESSVLFSSVQGVVQ